MTGEAAIARVAETIVEEQIVKSRHRVKTYGEVFTPRHMVDRMLDLVREELETGPDFVDKTFLEPAAGDGNFLVAILRRKLHAIEKRYPRRGLAAGVAVRARLDLRRSSCWRTTTRTRRRSCSPSSWRFHAGPRRSLRPAHRPAPRRGLPDRHEHRPRQHPDRPGPGAARTSSSRGGTGSPEHAGHGAARAVYARLAARGQRASTSPSTTATKTCRIDKVHEEVRADA